MSEIGDKVRIKADTVWHDVPIPAGETGTVILVTNRETAWVKLDGPEEAHAEFDVDNLVPLLH